MSVQAENPYITRRQQDVLDAMLTIFSQTNLPVPLKTLGERLGVTRVSIHGHMQVLVKKKRVRAIRRGLNHQYVPIVPRRGNEVIVNAVERLRHHGEHGTAQQLESAFGVQS